MSENLKETDDFEVDIQSLDPGRKDMFLLAKDWNRQRYEELK